MNDHFSMQLCFAYDCETICNRQNEDIARLRKNKNFQIFTTFIPKDDIYTIFQESFAKCNILVI